MRYIGCIAVILILCFAVSSIAEEASPQNVNLNLQLKPGESLRYSVKVQAVGTTTQPGATASTPLDITMELVMSYTVGKPADDGSIQVTIVPESASAIVSGQRMELPPSVVPKMTAIIDKKGEIIRLFTSDPATVKLPGLNSRNLILLFLPNAPNTGLTLGATWKKTVTLPPDREKYDFSYCLEALENVLGVQTARVKAELSVVAPEDANYSASGYATTNYALDDTRLIMSHVEMTVKTTTDDPSLVMDRIDAVVKIDVKLTSAVEPIK